MNEPFDNIIRRDLAAKEFLLTSLPRYRDQGLLMRQIELLRRMLEASPK